MYSTNSTTIALSFFFVKIYGGGLFQLCKHMYAKFIMIVCAFHYAD